MIHFWAGEGYIIRFAILAFGLPIAVWGAGEEWVKEGGIKGTVVLIGAGLAFVFVVVVPYEPQLLPPTRS